VRDTEALVRNFNVSKNIETPSKNTVNQDVPNFIKNAIPVFSEYFGHKIDVKVSSNGKGKITIPFHSEEDFNRLKKLVEGAK
ncbi:MAG: chromosome partitioning protein ParB, partial [Flavobacteriales bacterium 32-35-8]